MLRLPAHKCSPRPASYAKEKSIVVASTTSTQDSGLFSRILPLFKTKTGIDVMVLAQGTGQALDTGRRGDADVVFVHAKAAEKRFVADGFGVKRYPDRTKERSRPHQRRQGNSVRPSSTGSFRRRDRR